MGENILQLTGDIPIYSFQSMKTKNYLCYWRRSRGLTQEKLAKLAGTTQNTIARFFTPGI
jgi:predicted transcriptional regulator